MEVFVLSWAGEQLFVHGKNKLKNVRTDGVSRSQQSAGVVVESVPPSLPVAGCPSQRHKDQESCTFFKIFRLFLRYFAWKTENWNKPAPTFWPNCQLASYVRTSLQTNHPWTSFTCRSGPPAVVEVTALSELTCCFRDCQILLFLASWGEAAELSKVLKDPCCRLVAFCPEVKLWSCPRSRQVHVALLPFCHAL